MRKKNQVIQLVVLNSPICNTEVIGHINFGIHMVTDKEHMDKIRREMAALKAGHINNIFHPKPSAASLRTSWLFIRHSFYLHVHSCD